MSGMMPHMSPFSIARESRAMAKEADSPLFQNAATIVIGMAATTALLHAVHLVLHDFRQTEKQTEAARKLLPELNRHDREHGHRHGRGR
jgi:hypothetical protein